MAMSARSELVWLSRRRSATGLSSMVRRRARNWIIWPTVTESSSHVEDGPVAGALQNVAEDAHQVGGVGGDLRLGAGIFLKLADAGIGPRGGFEHLLFMQHLRGVFEALVLEQTLDQLAARIFGGVVGPGGSARQQHLALDVDEQRRGVDEIAGHIHVAGASWST